MGRPRKNPELRFVPTQITLPPQIKRLGFDMAYDDGLSLSELVSELIHREYEKRSGSFMKQEKPE